MNSIGDCRDCKGWRKCPGKEWYSFGEMRWCPQQIFWVLKHVDTLDAGQWPQATSTETAETKAQRVKSEAYFVKAVIILGQVRYRLKWTGWRGKLLAEESINRDKMLYLSGDAKDALYYVAGSKPKGRRFSLWLADRRYKKGDRNIAQLST